MSTPALTPELLDLMEHAIEQGITSMLDMAHSLDQIRTQKLYRAAGHVSFETYCQERWGISKSYASRLISAAEIAKELPRGNTPEPTSEKQVRPLKALPDPADRAEAWNDAVTQADGQQPTAKQVEAAVAKRRNPPAAKQHPAPYSDAVLNKIADHIHDANHDLGATILDPFAGTGRIHDLHDQVADIETIGIELEPEWAALHPNTIEGNALDLGYPDETIDAIATSPTYGNRMADTYTDDTVRLTYTACLGRDLHDDNSGILQWGPDYRAFHEAAWREAVRVLMPDGTFTLNIKNHVRDGRVQRVTEWHINTLVGLGLSVEALDVVPTRGLMAGENADKRTAHEFVITFRKRS